MKMGCGRVGEECKRDGTGRDGLGREQDRTELKWQRERRRNGMKMSWERDKNGKERDRTGMSA